MYTDLIMSIISFQTLEDSPCHTQSGRFHNSFIAALLNHFTF